MHAYRALLEESNSCNAAKSMFKEICLESSFAFLFLIYNSFCKGICYYEGSSEYELSISDALMMQGKQFKERE